MRRRNVSIVFFLVVSVFFLAFSAGCSDRNHAVTALRLKKVDKSKVKRRDDRRVTSVVTTFSVEMQNKNSGNVSNRKYYKEGVAWQVLIENPFYDACIDDTEFHQELAGVTDCFFARPGNRTGNVSTPPTGSINGYKPPGCVRWWKIPNVTTNKMGEVKFCATYSGGSPDELTRGCGQNIFIYLRPDGDKDKPTMAFIDYQLSNLNDLSGRDDYPRAAVDATYPGNPWPQEWENATEGVFEPEEERSPCSSNEIPDYDTDTDGDGVPDIFDHCIQNENLFFPRRCCQNDCPPDIEPLPCGCDIRNPENNRHYPDMNNNGCVDQTDWGLFQRCFSRIVSNIPLVVETPCMAGDFSDDGKVDMEDIRIFTGCFSGPMILAEEVCTSNLESRHVR